MESGVIMLHHIFPDLHVSHHSGGFQWLITACKQMI